MSGSTPTVYPIDYTGTANTNLIANESVTLADQAFRAFSPLYAPFFKKNIVIVDNGSGLRLTPTQYSCYNLISAPSAIAGIGNEVYAVILVTDDHVSNNLSISYQTVGGAYTSGYEAITGLVNNLLASNQVANTDPIDWYTIQNLPNGFPENLHLHSLGDTVGWEFMASQLEQLKLAIMLGDQINKNFVLSYIDKAVTNSKNTLTNLTGFGSPFGNHISNFSNPHNVTAAQIGLGNVVNYPVATTAQAYAGSAGYYVTADQVLAVVQNQINLGLDAHILNMNNPHQVTAAQIGLGLVVNCAVASLDDLNNPVSGTNLYVTNTVLGQYLDQYFQTQNSSTQTSLSSVTAQAQAALTAANTALATATADSDTATTAALGITAATTTANAALAAANQNLTNAQNSNASAVTLLQTYVASAVAAAQTAYFTKGYEAGYAAATAP